MAFLSFFVPKAAALSNYEQPFIMLKLTARLRKARLLV